VRGRHIQLHSRLSAEQSALGRLGADGAVRHAAGADHIGLVTDNASQSKIDWYLRRSVDYHLRYDPGSGRADGTVRVTLTNDAPASGEPAYVLGGDVAPAGYSRQIVQLYTPLDLSSATVDGHPPPVGSVRSLGESGNRAHEFDVAVPPKSSLTIELHLSGRLGAPGTGQLAVDLDHQPAVHPDHVTLTLDLAGGWRINGGSLNSRGTTASATRELDQNVQLLTEIIRK
jgi:hypothetical protein